MQTTYTPFFGDEEAPADPESLWENFGPALAESLPEMNIPEWEIPPSPIPHAIVPACSDPLILPLFGGDDMDDEFDEDIIRADRPPLPTPQSTAQTNEVAEYASMAESEDEKDGDEDEDEGENEEEAEEELLEYETWSPEDPRQGFQLVHQYVEEKPVMEDTWDPVAESGDRYEVEIVCALAAKRRGRGFLVILNVKWYGWTYAANTWEPCEDIPAECLPESLEEMEARASEALRPGTAAK